MNIISKSRSQQKTLGIATALLFALALTPASSIAANAEHDGYRNNKAHHTNMLQGNRRAAHNIKHQNNGHHNKHLYPEHHYYALQSHHRHGHGHARNRYRKPHYLLNNHRHYHPDPLPLQIGVHTANFNIVVRD